MREARFPNLKALDQIQWDDLQRVDRKQVAELASCGYLEQGEDVVIDGGLAQKPSGVDSRLLISSIALFNPPRSCPVTHMLPMLGDDWHNQYLVLDDAHIPGPR